MAALSVATPPKGRVEEGGSATAEYLSSSAHGSRWRTSKDTKPCDIGTGERDVAILHVVEVKTSPLRRQALSMDELTGVHL